MTRRLVATLMAIGAVAASGISGTYAAFSGTAANGSNKLDAGSVSVSDGHAASTAINITNLRPGTTVSNCINVSYDGSLPADVRQYAARSGSLATYIQIRVTRGSGLTGSWPSCTGFTADGTNYIGQGSGVVYDGALSSFPSSSGAATLDPTNGAAETWTNPESHAYKYDVWLTNSSAAQGLSGSLTITWDAQNL